MARVQLEKVSKVFDDVRALDDVTLAIDDGELLVLVGPSGCGKSTLLRIVAGLEGASTGTVTIGDRDVTAEPPARRDIAMIFQDYALYPHMTVRKNLAFGIRQLDKGEIDRRVTKAAGMLEIGDLLDRRPRALSGGQRQRVAMGRAIVRDPNVFLMDEPLSNLDAKLRVTTRAELIKLHQRVATTTIYVTHDQVEAMTLGDRVALMRDGRIEQCGTPRELFDHPVNAFVATFLGLPPMNLVEAPIEAGAAHVGGVAIPLPAAVRAQADRTSVVVGVRPTALRLADADSPPDGTIEVKVDVVEDTGTDVHAFFVIPGRVPTLPGVHRSTEDALVVSGSDGVVEWVARLPADHVPSVGKRLRLRLAPDEVYYFDAVDGRTLSPSAEQR